MGLSKNPKFDLKLKFRRIIEIGLIFALALIILAFKYFPEIQNDIEVIELPGDDVRVLDIPSTRHKRPEVPPKIPQLKVYEPADEALEEIEVDLNPLEVNDEISSVPPEIKLKNEELEPVYFEVVESTPQIIGGIGAIASNLEYPELAKKACIQGTVIIFAYIDEEGNVEKVEIAKNIGAGCGLAAAEAVKRVKFTPGKQRNKAVKCRVSVPVKFLLR